MPSFTNNMVIGYGGHLRVSVSGSAGYVRREVTRWSVNEKYLVKELAHSGGGGHMIRKCVCLDWDGHFEIPYFDNIDLHVDLKVGLEVPVWFTANDGSTHAGLAIVTGFKTVSDSSGTDVVQIAIDLVCAGPLPQALGGPNTLLPIDLATTRPVVFTP